MSGDNDARDDLHVGSCPVLRENGEDTVRPAPDVLSGTAVPTGDALICRTSSRVGYGVVMTVEASTTLADLVIEDGRRARVLEGFGIDYCCHGHRSLAAATAEADVDLDDLRTALDLPGVSTHQMDRSQERADLAHDIVDTHHAYMWQEMPRLQALVEKVHRVHGDRHPELTRVNALSPRRSPRSIRT